MDTSDPAAGPPGADPEGGRDSRGGDLGEPDTLGSERRHLDRSWAALRAMRAETEALTDTGADELTSWSLGALRGERLTALADDPAVARGRSVPGAAAPPPLFFGRVDWDPATGRRPSHLGRRHIREASGDEPLVVDWRAPMSRAFYQATPADPMGARRRRRFGYADGELTSYEDEPLDVPDIPAGADGPGAVNGGRILRAEIERPRVGPMRDIVATIQPDQDDIVRAGLDQSICVQGAPGTGKTAVGLHRAAYLLYTYPDRLRRAGVLVIGPNRAFLGYIAAVLPALGELDVDQVTVDDLVAGRLRLRGRDDPDVARLKGDPRLAEVLRRATYRGVTRPADPVVVPVGAGRYRVPPERLRRWVDDLVRGRVRYAVARERLRALVAQDVRRQWETRGGAPTDREIAAIARSAPVRAALDALWPPVDPAGLVARLLSDPDALAEMAAGLLDPDECAALSWPRAARTVRAVRWSAADAVLIDEVAGLLDRPAGFGHVVVDEAQDLSGMQCRAVGRRCSAGSLTVLGDLAQATTPGAGADWPSTLAWLGHPDAQVRELTRGYRVPGEVLDLANRLLPHIAPGLPPATSTRRADGALRIDAVGPDLPAAAAERVRGVLDRPGSVGLICADSAVPALARALVGAGLPHDVAGDDAGGGPDGRDRPGPAHRISVVPVSLAKGLEFDQVVLVEPADIVRDEPVGLARLYVALTRAVSHLIIVHYRRLPVELTG
ncbi:MAG TPA: AAA family ATPase [Mycobacteriales bacterium]|nr:AAA family ATPase [Mycobacteriales bacterium]